MTEHTEKPGAKPVEGAAYPGPTPDQKEQEMENNGMAYPGLAYANTGMGWNSPWALLWYKIIQNDQCGLGGGGCGSDPALNARLDAVQAAQIASANASGQQQIENRVENVAQALCTCCCNLQSGQKEIENAICNQTNVLENQLCNLKSDLTMQATLNTQRIVDGQTANLLAQKDGQIAALNIQLNEEKQRCNMQTLECVAEQNRTSIQRGIERQTNVLESFLISNCGCCPSNGGPPGPPFGNAAAAARTK